MISAKSDARREETILEVQARNGWSRRQAIPAKQESAKQPAKQESAKAAEHAESAKAAEHAESAKAAERSSERQRKL